MHATVGAKRSARYRHAVYFNVEEEMTRGLLGAVWMVMTGCAGGAPGTETAPTGADGAACAERSVESCEDADGCEVELAIALAGSVEDGTCGLDGGIRNTEYCSTTEPSPETEVAYYDTRKSGVLLYEVATGGPDFAGPWALCVGGPDEPDECACTEVDFPR